MAVRDTHWDEVYGRAVVTQVSWFQREPRCSLELVAESGIRPEEALVDVGAGASVLVDRLLDAGYRDVTALDLAADALAVARSRLGPRAGEVHWVTGDLLRWQPDRRYRLWHDRAVFHFLTEPAERDRYRTVLRRVVPPGGHIVIGTFAADGPTHCSGLPTARYAPDQLAAEFPGFEVVRHVREEHRTPGGSLQPFTWLLLVDRRRTGTGDPDRPTRSVRRFG
ncbi:MAG TPA: methyltransferase domain-containing protein [Micromonospora sp.]